MSDTTTYSPRAPTEEPQEIVDSSAELHIPELTTVDTVDVVETADVIGEEKVVEPPKPRRRPVSNVIEEIPKRPVPKILPAKRAAGTAKPVPAAAVSPRLTKQIPDEVSPASVIMPPSPPRRRTKVEYESREKSEPWDDEEDSIEVSTVTAPIARSKAMTSTAIVWIEEPVNGRKDTFTVVGENLNKYAAAFKQFQYKTRTSDTGLTFTIASRFKAEVRRVVDDINDGRITNKIKKIAAEDMDLPTVPGRNRQRNMGSRQTLVYKVYRPSVGQIVTLTNSKLGKKANGDKETVEKVYTLEVVGAYSNNKSLTEGAIDKVKCVSAGDVDKYNRDKNYDIIELVVDSGVWSLRYPPPGEAVEDYTVVFNNKTDSRRRESPVRRAAGRTGPTGRHAVGRDKEYDSGSDREDRTDRDSRSGYREGPRRGGNRPRRDGYQDD